jgi:hypothetical protein
MIIIPRSVPVSPQEILPLELTSRARVRRRLRCRETLMIVLHTSFLITRTLLSVLVAKLDGRIVRDVSLGSMADERRPS